MASESLCIRRLTNERRTWRKEPLFGFVARPAKKEDGSPNLQHWECVIPGKNGTAWEGGRYKLRMIFEKDYPATPPKCIFDPPVFHQNVLPSGKVCLSILDDKRYWTPTITIKSILKRIQTVLHEPITEAPAQEEAFNLFCLNRTEYVKRVRNQARLSVGWDE